MPKVQPEKLGKLEEFRLKRDKSEEYSSPEASKININEDTYSDKLGYKTLNHVFPTIVKEIFVDNKDLEISISKDSSTKSEEVIPLSLRQNYNKKLEKYNTARERIFCNEIKLEKAPISKRIQRTRERYKMRRHVKHAIESSMLDSPRDIRPYGEVNIFGKTMVGLLDSGSSVTVLGKGSEELIRELGLKMTPFIGHVLTADGSPQQIIGRIKDVKVKFRGKIETIDVMIGPSLKQTLYLGWDFMNKFGLAQDLFKANVEEVQEVPPEAKENESLQHELDPQQSKRLAEIIDMFPSYTKLGLGRTHLLTHTIDTGDALPIKQRHYPYSPAIQKKLEEAIDRMLSEGIIRESESGWNSPITPVIKPDKVRLCLDARKVNSVTKPFAYPLPNIGGLLSRLGETVYISSVDLKDAFWQISLDESSKEKTAFTIPGRPLYEFNVMPFGLSNAAQRLCQLMDKVIPSQFRDRVFVYLDDLLIFSKNFDDHLELLKMVATKLKDAGLTINVEKSKFCFKQLRYLGYIVGNETIQTDPKKVEAITQLKEPKTLKQLRSFIGMCSWYRRFIHDFSTIAAPLTECLKVKKGGKFKLNSEACVAFEALKRRLTEAPVLINPDFEKEFIIACDASRTGVGGVLAQLDEEGNERAICFFSHKLNPAQRNYSITELECLAAVLCIKAFRPYVEGHKFKVITDHASLKWLMSQKDLTGRLARWSMKLSQFDFSIEHRKGCLNVVPDTLSRSFNEAIEELNPVPIDLTDPEFKSVAYLDLIEYIQENQDTLPDLKVEDGFVFKRTHFLSRDIASESECWRLWLPADLCQKVMTTFHDPPNCSHGGFVKTLKRIQKFFYWPKMAVEIKGFVQNCQTCREIKDVNTNLRPEMGQQFTVERPFQHVYIDFLGPYPRTKKGNTVILIVLDQFSKFSLAKALPKATATNVIKYLSEIFSIFGVPESILSDNGSQFISKEFQNFLNSLGIKHCRTGSYAPQSNASERVNRTILTSIRAYVGDQHDKWDYHLQDIMSSIRNSIHSAIGTTPYEVLFGQNMIIHGTLYRILRKLGALGGEDCRTQTSNAKLKIIRDEVHKNLTKAHEKYRKQYNLRSKHRKFEEGQEVYRRNHVLSSSGNKVCKKFAKKFLKCKVKTQKGTNLYELEDYQGKALGVFHAKDLVSS